MKFHKYSFLLVIGIIIFFSYWLIEIKPIQSGKNDKLLSLPYLDYSSNYVDLSKIGLVKHEEGAMEGNIIIEKFIIDKDGNLFNYSYAFKEDFTIFFGRLIKSQYADNLDYAMSKYFIHHDIFQLNNTNLMILTKDFHYIDEKPVLFDRIVEINKDGKEVFSYDTFDHIEALDNLGIKKDKKLNQPGYNEEDKDEIKSFLNVDFPIEYDYFHANSIYEIQENKNSKDPRFRKGNILVSLLYLNLIIILDKETSEIVWSYGPGETFGTHAATMLNNGNIILFDNGNNVQRNKSRILEINPLNKSIFWEYSDESFYSDSRGFVQRLPNNNTLITESTKGRIFEVTPKKKIVWDYYLPILNDDGQRLLIYRAIKIPSNSLNLSKQNYNMPWKSR